MDFSSINAVVNRIEDIEYKIGMRRPRGGAVGFHQMLKDEIKAKTPNRGGNAAVQSPSQNTQRPKGEEKSASASEKANTLPLSVPQDSAYFPSIQEAAVKYGVDPKLVSAVAEVESGYEQGAISATGAVGVMQLMPETAESLGVNPYDAAQNIDGGAKYLKQMLDTFGGDVRKAVAAYNAGPEAVHEYGGVPPYSETQQYVSSVLDLYR